MLDYTLPSSPCTHALIHMCAQMHAHLPANTCTSAHILEHTQMYALSLSHAHAHTHRIRIFFVKGKKNSEQSIVCVTPSSLVALFENFFYGFGHLQQSV